MVCILIDIVIVAYSIIPWTLKQLIESWNWWVQLCDCAGFVYLYPGCHIARPGGAHALQHGAHRPHLHCTLHGLPAWVHCGRGAVWLLWPADSALLHTGADGHCHHCCPMVHRSRRAGLHDCSAGPGFGCPWHRSVTSELVRVKVIGFPCQWGFICMWQLVQWWM